jgi:hypothetical protein
VERSADKTIVKMALHMNRRAWIDKLILKVDAAFADTG